MKWATLRMLVMLVLGMCYRCALGFPVYDFDPSSLQEALKASVAKVNSQSLSPYLFQETRSSLKRVNVLDEDTLVMNLEFSVQETTCLRDSGDPSSCTFRRGYYVVTWPICFCILCDQNSQPLWGGTLADQKETTGPDPKCFQPNE